MGKVNLITGTAHGKIGKIQYQSKGLKCIVRSAQPIGLSNNQATQINKPVFDKLSQEYNSWGRWALSEFETDLKKPQGAWNYYTKQNENSFKTGVTETTGWYVGKHTKALLGGCVYHESINKDYGIIQFADQLPVDYVDYDILIIFAIGEHPIAECEKRYVPYNNAEQHFDFIETAQNVTKIIGLIVSKDHKTLITGAFDIQAGGEVGDLYWNCPTNFINNGIQASTTNIGTDNQNVSISIDSQLIPEEYTTLSVKWTYLTEISGHLAGSSEIEPIGNSKTLTAPAQYYAIGTNIIQWELWNVEKNKSASSICKCTQRTDIIDINTLIEATGFTATWKTDFIGNLTITLTPPAFPTGYTGTWLKLSCKTSKQIASIPSGREFSFYSNTVQSITDAYGTPPQTTDCFKLQLFDSRTGVAFSTVQNVALSRTRIDATQDQIESLYTIVVENVTGATQTTRLLPGGNSLPDQYKDCFLRLYISTAQTGIAVGTTMLKTVGTSEVLGTGTNFRQKGMSFGNARLWDNQLSKEMSFSGNLKSNYELTPFTTLFPLASFYMSVVLDVSPMYNVTGYFYPIEDQGTPNLNKWVISAIGQYEYGMINSTNRTYLTLDTNSIYEETDRYYIAYTPQTGWIHAALCAGDYHAEITDDLIGEAEVS